MPFWTYMLYCADRSFCVGHTDDLDARLAQHDQGTLGGYTHSRHPVALVWSDQFPTRYEALSAERQIKGWTRAKKLALIRGDWAAISALARNRQEKNRPSTGSGRTGLGEKIIRTHVGPGPVEGSHFPFRLLAHPDCSNPAIDEIAAAANLVADTLALMFTLRGHLADLVIPPLTAPTCADGLWRHTCFEAFAAGEGATYHEFNLSPSSRWAAYRFTGYRDGMEQAEMQAVSITVDRSEDRLDLTATLLLPNILPPGPLRLGLCAVIEAADGSLSYWALAHPPGAPDFHHPDCFAATLVSQGAP